MHYRFYTCDEFASMMCLIEVKLVKTTDSHHTNAPPGPNPTSWGSVCADFSLLTEQDPLSWKVLFEERGSLPTPTIHESTCYAVDMYCNLFVLL